MGGPVPPSPPWGSPAKTAGNPAATAFGGRSVSPGGQPPGDPPAWEDQSPHRPPGVPRPKPPGTQPLPPSAVAPSPPGDNPPVTPRHGRTSPPIAPLGFPGQNRREPSRYRLRRSLRLPRGTTPR